MDVRTRGGVFGPGGYGGGIFDGSGMGFGGIGCTEQRGRGLLGMGATSEPPFVWMAKGDPRVSRLETALSKELASRGFKPLSVDGQLGPKVCGAIAWLGTLGATVDFASNPDLNLMDLMVDQSKPAGQQAVCRSFTYPTKVGSSTPFKPPNTFHAALPWGVFDPQTQGMEQNLNGDLAAHGYKPIAADGILGPPACGAMRLASTAWGMDYLGEYGANCQSFQDPQAVSKPPATPPPPVLADGPPTMGGTKKRSSMTTAWVVGGLLGAAALAGVYATRRKG